MSSYSCNKCLYSDHIMELWHLYLYINLLLKEVNIINVLGIIILFNRLNCNEFQSNSAEFNLVLQLKNNNFVL